MRVTVFCGAKNGIDPVYATTAYQLGKSLAENHHTLVFGGSSVGLMGHVSQWALDGGGKVIGFFPRNTLKSEEKTECSHEHYRHVETTDMQERKKELVKHADAIILAPGGWGSLDELFEVLTLNQIGVTNITVGILNVNGYYDSLLKLFDDMIEKGFVSEKHRKWYIERKDVDSLLKDLLDA